MEKSKPPIEDYPVIPPTTSKMPNSDKDNSYPDSEISNQDKILATSNPVKSRAKENVEIANDHEQPLENGNTEIFQEQSTLNINVRMDFFDFFSDDELNILENLFLMANMAQDGRINVSEMKFFLDLHDYVISDQEARQIIKQGDLDGDCALSFREFLSLCKKAELKVHQITQDRGNKSSGCENISQDIFIDSIKIRKIFQAIFATIDFHPDVRETVEFFENKIAEGAKGFEIEAHKSPSKARKLGDTDFKSSKSYTIIKSFGNRKSPPLESTARITFDDTTAINSTKSVAEIGYGGDTVIDEIPSIEPSKESLADESHNVEGIIQQELLRIEREVIEAECQTNPLFDYDLIVIGGGAGGSAAAKEASKYGKRVAICDFMMPSSLVKSWGWRFGGSCVNVGCVPKMLMHHSGFIGEYFDKSMSLPFGWFSPDSDNNACVNWSILVDNIQSHIRTMNYEKQFGLSYYKGIKYFNSYCEFDGPHRILLTHDDKRKEIITGERILIAVGSLYQYLDVPGAAGNCITADDIFSLRNHPGKVLIVGGGPDAIECAGLLCSLNIEVTLMSRSPALKGFDRRMVTLILETLHSRGVKLMIGWSPSEIINDRDVSRPMNGIVRNLTVVAKHYATDERSSYGFNTIVLAIGKMPCTPLLKLDKAEVLIDDKTSKIWVDSQDMTTAEDIFAIGDCASDRPSGTPICYQAGVTLSKRLFDGSAKVIEYDQTLPKFLMTPVEYGSIGLSEEAAIIEHGQPNIIVYHSRLQPLQYQLANKYKDTYYAKLITLKSEQERIIGLHYLGPNAGEVIQGFTLSITKFKATKADFDAMIGIHPTCAEIFSRMTKTSAAEIGEETSC